MTKITDTVEQTLHGEAKVLKETRGAVPAHEMTEPFFRSIAHALHVGTPQPTPVRPDVKELVRNRKHPID